MSEQTTSNKKNMIGQILGWILGVLFALIGIISILSEPIPGLVMLVMAAVFLPPVTKLVDQKWKFHLSVGMKIVVIVIGLIIVGVTIDNPNVSTTQQAETERGEQPQNESNEQKDNVIETIPTSSDGEKEQPSWYGQELLIDSSEFEFMTSKEVNVWPSLDDRSEIVTKVTKGDKVTITGYDAENDYCKIKKDKQEGWIACAWINNLPDNMTDSWQTQ